MKKAVIKNLDNIETNAAIFQTQELAETWFEDNKAAFGKPERELIEINFQDETIEDAIETTQIEILGELVNLYKFPATYSVEYIDVTDELAEQQEMVQAREFLNATDWYVIRNLETGVAIPEEITTQRAEARLKI